MSSSIAARSGTSNMSRSGLSQPVGELALDVDAAGEGEVQRDRLARRADLDRDAVVANQQVDLLDQIGVEQVRLGDRRV